MDFTETPPSGNRNFLKLKDKESVEVVFRGTPHIFYKIWDNGKSKICDETHPDAKWSFRINAIMKENGLYIAKIWEGGVTVYNMLKDLNEEYPLETTVVKITRSGMGTDTVYSSIPLLKKQINPETFIDVKLNDLSFKKNSLPEEETNWDLPL